MARTTLTTGTSDADNTTYQTAPFTPTAGRLLVVFVLSGGQPFQNGTVAPIAVGQPGLTVSQLVSTKHPASELQLTCFRGWVTGPVGNNPLRFDFGTRQQRWCAWTVYEFDDIDATANGSQAIAAAFPNSTTLATNLDTGFAPPGAMSIAAIALDQHVLNIAPGPGSAAVDNLLTNAVLANGQLNTLQRAADGGLPSVRWQWTGAANAVSITLSLNPAPSDPGEGPGVEEELTPTEKLVRQFEPILFLDPNERFVPVDAKRYLEHCRLWNTKTMAAADDRGSWGRYKYSKFPRTPWAEAGELVGRPEEAGFFISNDDVRYAAGKGVEFWLEMGGWRDLAGAQTYAVDSDTVNTYADSDEVARQYAEVPELDASKFWYHAEVFDTAKLRQLLGTVSQPDLMRILVQLNNPTLLCYYIFFPFHEQHGYGQGCEAQPKDQLVGSCGGDWTCVAVLLEGVGAGGELLPTYIGLTGEQIFLEGRPGVPFAAHHFDDDNRINMNVMRWTGATIATEGDHPRVHVAPGNHAFYSFPGAVTGLAFPWDAMPVQCGEWDNDSLVPDLTPSWAETVAVLIAKLGFGPVGWVYAAIEAQQALEHHGPQWFPPPYPRDTEYPAAGAGLTIKPKGVDVPDAGAQSVEWRSRDGLVINNRRYDYIVDRVQQQFWPLEPHKDPAAVQPHGYFDGMWGPRVENDPLSRRVGQRFPDFWKMFFLAIADGQANESLPF
ncbi:hypothetical protein [Mycolicibacterium sp. 120270]|uniref:hypothetical protein n=1 Tax=Mycolicibacterium sp. 120270 TaxID=3090600 RepID=UPI00299EC81E|nr:hypothetical protein [Mycolicibacterium sp. 120270]MDX1883228.1 hypothetical protein [Mycolicibacterium sp. 120270]